MKKLLLALALIGLLLAIGIVMAPARLASNALESAFPRQLTATNLQQNAQTSAPGGLEIRLLGPSGTLWNGSGALLVNRQPIGNLSWQVQPGRLLSLEAAVDWQLDGDGFAAEGTAAARNQSYDLRNLRGTVSQALLRKFLGRYDIAPSGALTVDSLDITDLQLNERMNWPAQVTAAGTLKWTGGPVRYRLAGQTYDIDLPPMLGTISSSESGPHPGWPELLVTDANEGDLLITGRLTPTGSAAIGITRGFTRLAGQPWPGSEPDHAVVLEVEEQLN